MKPSYGTEEEEESKEEQEQEEEEVIKVDNIFPFSIKKPSGIGFHICDK